MLEVQLLGQFVVSMDGDPIKINSRPAQSLLAYLLINAGKAYRREKLAGLLWPDTTDANSRNNLRQALWRIRKSLEADAAAQPYFLVDDLTVAFNVETDYSLDVNKLEAELNELVPISDLIETVSLYDGELLPGFYDDWIVLERERLHSVFESQMDLLIHRLIEQLDWHKVIEWCERWIASGSVPEPAYRSLMIAHAGRGDLSSVAATYHRCEEAMLNELGLEPSESTQDLFEQLKTGKNIVPELVKETESMPPSPPLDEAPTPGEPPYKGLQSYDEADAGNFFGREELTETICNYLIDGNPFISIIGASGSGKSSVVHAGLIPALKSGRLPGNGRPVSYPGLAWKAWLLTPTAHPTKALAKSLSRDDQGKNGAESLDNELKRDSQTLRKYLSQSPHFNAQNKESKTTTRVLIVIDQFEELFTLCQDEIERRAFINNLTNAVNTSSDNSISVVITLRADFYAHCGKYPELRQILTKNQIYIGPMNAEDIRRVIEGPAQRGGWNFEPGLVELILRDVSKEPGALPLLSHALLETWHRRRGRTLTLRGYATSGGVRGGIARTAESVYNLQLSSTQQQIAKNIFLRLTNLGEETEGTRRRANQAELFPATKSASPVQEVLSILADARLITIDENSVEVAHEALIIEWPTLRNWLIENREELRFHRHLTEAAQAWDELDRNPGELYRGARLSQALEWFDSEQSNLSILEQDFLAASQERAEQAKNERRAQQERELAAALELAKAQEERAEAEKELADNQSRTVAQLRRRAVYLTGALIFVLVMAGIALYLGERVRQTALSAQASAEKAEQESWIAFSRELAAAAVSNLDLDPERSILLALSAVTEAQSAGLPVPREAEEALHRTVLASRLRTSLEGGFSVDFSPDGSLIAYSGPDSTAIIQEFPSGREVVVLSGHSGDLFGVSVEFSSNGEQLITTSADKTAKIWDLSSGEELLTLRGHTETLTDGIFSPDGTLAATTGNDHTVRVWNIKTGEESFRITLPEPGGIAFDPSGNYLAVTDTSLSGGSIEIWDVTSGQKTITLAGHDQGAFGAAFNTDGTQLISVGQDQQIKIWDASNGDELLTLVDTVPIYELAISPDGKQIATGGEDGAAKVWDIESAELLMELPGHSDTVSFLAFSPDSRFLATSSFDQTTKIWDISPEGNTEWLTLPGHTRVIMSANYSLDGQKIVSGSWDGTAILWDAINGKKHLTIQDIEAEVGRAILNQDQTQLVTADFSGSVKIWDANTGELHQSIQAHSPGDIDVAFSPDEEYIGSGGSDGIAKLWATGTGKLVREFEGHSDVIQRIAFSPDGSLLASGSWDGTAKLWEVNSGELLSTLSANAGNVRSVDFSPDGKLLATAHEDGTARIWDISFESAGPQSGDQLLRTLIGHSNTIFDATFSPDGIHLATTSFDGTVRLWDVESGREVLLLAENTGGPDLDFSPDGKFLVLGGGDGAVRVFLMSIEDLIDLANTRLTRTMTLEECQKYLHQDTCPGSEAGN